MKKTLILAGAALLALVACNKSETVVKEAPGEISFKAVTGNLTKAGELNGDYLTAGYGIYAAATQKNSTGEIENPSFFSDEKLFQPEAAETDKYSQNWVATPKVYWPLGNVKMDFLAYAIPTAKHEDPYTSGTYSNEWQAKWDAKLTDVAKTLTFNEVNTYLAANRIDVLYANANDQISAVNGLGGTESSVKLDFKHAQALLIFNVKVNNVAAGINIKEIAFLSDDYVAARLADQIADAAAGVSTPYDAPDVADDEITLLTQGTFTVDNSKINLEAKWSGLVPLNGQYAMPSGVAAVSLCNVGPTTGNFVDYNTAISSANSKAADTWYQLGETLLIPEQEKVNFTITYTIGSNTYYYTYNDLRGVWEKGKKYIYNLDMTINEIVITESVADFAVNTTTVSLD